MVLLLTRVLILLMLATNNSYSGVDFSGLGEGDQAMYVEDAPFFNSYDQAVKYAMRIKWNERILIELKKRSKELWIDAYDKEVGWMLAGQRQEGNMYRDQWLRINVAVHLIEKFKSKGERGENVGSTFYAGSEPVYGSQMGR